MYRPSDLHKLLNELGAHPKKSLSQNFLIDGNIIRKIISAAGVLSDDVVLEIGPGPGALTQELLNRGALVIAVEKDRVLAEHLSRLPGDLTVYNDDILDFDFSDKLDPCLKGRRAKVIANLPYHITTPIITKLVKMHDRLDSLVIMVQHEVAARMTALPGGKDYGSLTVFLNFHCHAEYAFKVKRTCFYPVPKVDSAVVRLQLKEPPAISNPEQFEKIVRKAFEQRRKMLRKSLSEIFSPEAIIRALEENGLNPQARPEELSLSELIDFFEALSSP
jgi:16S rRNA (adenine1518-N6/adenine1519-N6)-dimethyltransferase